MIGLASIATAGAIWLSIDRRTLLIKIRLDDSSIQWVHLVRFVIVVGAVFIGWSQGFIGIILAATFAAIGTFVVHHWSRHKKQKLRQKQNAMTAEAFEAIAADLHAGAPPAVALGRLGEHSDFFAPAANAAMWGGDVAHALRDSGMNELAAAWEVAESSGAALSAILEQMSQTVDENREAQREIELSLAPAQATARTMAILPIIAIVLGSFIGYEPLRIVTTTIYGALSFAGGCAFAMVGVWWVDRLAAKAGG